MHAIDSGLDLSLLRVFAVLAQERNVTRAARRLGLTQSATSHALGRLRRAFGDPLFVRGSGGVIATDRATLLAPEITELVRRIDALASAPGVFDPARLARTFTIAGGDFAELLVLPRLLQALAPAAPTVDLRFRPIAALTEDDLARGQLDLAIGVFPEASPRLIQKKLFVEGFVCMLRRGHPALDKPLTAKRFAELGHILISPRGDGPGAVDELLAERGLRRRIVVRTASFLTAPLLVEASDCISTLPRRVAETMMHGRALVLVPPPLAIPRFTVVMAFHERARADPAHAWLRDRIAEVSREL